MNLKKVTNISCSTGVALVGLTANRIRHNYKGFCALCRPERWRSPSGEKAPALRVDRARIGNLGCSTGNTSFIVVLRYDQLASGILYGNPSAEFTRRRYNGPRPTVNSRFRGPPNNRRS